MPDAVTLLKGAENVEQRSNGIGCLTNLANENSCGFELRYHSTTSFQKKDKYGRTMPLSVVDTLTHFGLKSNDLRHNY